jgi:serine/threonine protein kinase
MGLGSALSYLHRDWDQCVVHGDIKPSNIMLDSSYNAKLGDFGLARLADHGTGPQTTMNVSGTRGYIDPDFVNTCRRSTESDVYNFGIVLLEIVSGKPPVVVQDQEPPFLLLKWVWSLHSQGAILDAADARLRSDDDWQVERALVVGLWCSHHEPAQRPSIVDAMHTLQAEDAKLPVLPPHMYKLPRRLLHHARERHLRQLLLQRRPFFRDHRHHTLIRFVLPQLMSQGLIS